MKPLWFDKVLALSLLVVLGIALGCSGVGAQPPSADNGGAPPFAASHPVDIPKGTPIYVRLQHSISSSSAQAGESFSAILDEPLTINGQTLAAAGTQINGRVVAARKSGHLHNAGYLRLTLSSITLGWQAVALQPSSMLVYGRCFGNTN